MVKGWSLVQEQLERRRRIHFQLVSQRNWHHLLNEETRVGDPSCPSGTLAAGYAMDSWEKWRPVCLAALSVEDIEDVYIFGAIVTGVSLIGFALAFRQILGSVATAQSSHQAIKEVVVAVKGPSTLPAMIDGLGRAVGTQAGTMNRYMDTCEP